MEMWLLSATIVVLVVTLALYRREQAAVRHDLRNLIDHLADYAEENYLYRRTSQQIQQSGTRTQERGYEVME